jgi:hypothetical protein
MLQVERLKKLELRLFVKLGFAFQAVLSVYTFFFGFVIVMFEGQGIFYPLEWKKIIKKQVFVHVFPPPRVTSLHAKASDHQPIIL